jgi:hypothetical protein
MQEVGQGSRQEEKGQRPQGLPQHCRGRGVQQRRQALVQGRHPRGQQRPSPASKNAAATAAAAAAAREPPRSLRVLVAAQQQRGGLAGKEHKAGLVEGSGEAAGQGGQGGAGQQGHHCQRGTRRSLLRVNGRALVLRLPVPLLRLLAPPLRGLLLLLLCLCLFSFLFQLLC